MKEDKNMASYWPSNSEEDRQKRQDAIDFLNEQNQITSEEEEYYEETDYDETDTEPIYTGEEEETDENTEDNELITPQEENLTPEPENPNQ